MPIKDKAKLKEYRRNYSRKRFSPSNEPIEVRRERLRKQRRYKRLADLTKGDKDGTKLGTFIIDPKTLGLHSQDPTICPSCKTPHTASEYLDSWIRRNGVCNSCYSKIFVERSAKYLGLGSHLKVCHETTLAELHQREPEDTQSLYSSEVIPTLEEESEYEDND